MKGISVLILITSLTPIICLADSSQCYSIKSNDLRIECLAITHNDKSRCYTIRDNDLKNSCLAKLSNQKSRCYSVKDHDQRLRCLAGF